MGIIVTLQKASTIPVERDDAVDGNAGLQDCRTVSPASQMTILIEIVSIPKFPVSLMSLMRRIAELTGAEIDL